jgi:hypothetical protein
VVCCWTIVLLAAAIDEVATVVCWVVAVPATFTVRFAVPTLGSAPLAPRANTYFPADTPTLGIVTIVTVAVKFGVPEELLIAIETPLAVRICGFPTYNVVCPAVPDLRTTLTGTEILPLEESVTLLFEIMTADEPDALCAPTCTTQSCRSATKSAESAKTYMKFLAYLIQNHLEPILYITAKL